MDFPKIDNFIKNKDIIRGRRDIVNANSIPATINSIYLNTDEVDNNYSTYNYEINEKTTQKKGKVICNNLEEISCNGGYECIKKEYMCDGMYDCYDKSDESPDICKYQKINSYQEKRGRFRPPTLKCPKTWFFCKDASKCVEPMAVCDGYNDCRDGSDESSFCYYLNIQRKKNKQ
uniref:Low-density lipoprotein receptor-related protein 2 n=1 Tax=Strongyloides venezuelensis TaxID=75913 RepID=A0A0K0EX13_STRVS